MMDAVQCHHQRRFPVIGDSLDESRGLLDLRRLPNPSRPGPAAAETTRLAPFISPVTSVVCAELLP